MFSYADSFQQISTERLGNGDGAPTPWPAHKTEFTLAVVPAPRR